MNNKITLQTLAGVIAGSTETMEHDCDEIKCNEKRCGFVGHAEGSMIRFLPWVQSPNTKAEIHAEVVRLRAEQGKEPISDKFSSAPSPEKLRAAIAELNAQEDEEDDE